MMIGAGAATVGGVAFTRTRRAKLYRELSRRVAAVTSTHSLDMGAAQRAYAGRYGGGDNTGAMMGGIIIGDMLGGAMRGGFGGGWGPTSFGGSSGSSDGGFMGGGGRF